MKKYDEALKGFDTLIFNVLDMSRMIPRDSVLPVLTFKLISEMDIMDIVEEDKLSKFINQA